MGGTNGDVVKYWGTRHVSPHLAAMMGYEFEGVPQNNTFSDDCLVVILLKVREGLNFLVTRGSAVSHLRVNTEGFSDTGSGSDGLTMKDSVGICGGGTTGHLPHRVISPLPLNQLRTRGTLQVCVFTPSADLHLRVSSRSQSFTLIFFFPLRVFDVDHCD
jgi:hypothetical protein